MNLLRIWPLLFVGFLQLAGGGSVTGTVRLPGGEPAANVRVAAMVAPGAGRGTNRVSVLASLTLTDEDGHYRLENVPPGRYFIAAGAIASPTYYPGVPAEDRASTVTVSQGGPEISGIDFVWMETAANSPAVSPAPGTCCALSGLVLMQDGSSLPLVPLKIVDSARNVNIPVEGDGFFRFFLPYGTNARLALDGLPPGYTLNSVIYGGVNTGPSVRIDGRLPSFLMVVSVQPGTTLPTVTVHGRVVNIAPELNSRDLSLVLKSPTITETDVATPVRADFSFEISEVPIGNYRVVIRDAFGSEWSTSSIAPIFNAVSELNVDLLDDPFPEADRVSLFSSPFTNRKITISGVATTRLLHGSRPSGREAYFRMDIKNASTGLMTSWAVFVSDSKLVPNVTPGETYTLTGTVVRDGTYRMKAEPF